MSKKNYMKERFVCLHYRQTSPYQLIYININFSCFLIFKAFLNPTYIGLKYSLVSCFALTIGKNIFLFKFKITKAVSCRIIFFYWSSGIMVRSLEIFTNFCVAWYNMPPSPPIWLCFSSILFLFPDLCDLWLTLFIRVQSKPRLWYLY